MTEEQETGYLDEQRAVYRESPFLRHLGVELADLAPGRAEVRLVAGPELLNRSQAVHGGVLATLVDTAMGQAVYTRIGLDTPVVTAEFKVNFLAPARAGLLVARGEVVRMGGSLAAAEARVTDAEGELVAVGLGTFRFFTGKRGGSRQPG